MKILLVDDSKSARYALRLQLQHHGVEVDTADSAESAFEILKGELPDAILMDHMMPGLNGFEALEVIREDPRTAHLPVVMCTSHEDADFAATAQRKGVLGILPKSGAPEKLPAILDKLRDSIRVPPSLASGPPTNQAPSTARPGLAVAAAGPATGIDESKLLARVDERISARITALLDDLRRDLSERLTAEAHHEIDSRLEPERLALERRLQDQQARIEAHLDQQRRVLKDRLEDMSKSREAALLESSRSALPGLVEDQVKVVLPGLVKVEIEGERGQIMALVEQYLRDLGPRAQEPATRRLDPRELAVIDQSLAKKAAEVARFEAQTLIEAALNRNPEKREPLLQDRPSLTGVYLAVIGAALAGIGAAAAVYLILS